MPAPSRSRFLAVAAALLCLALGSFLAGCSAKTVDAANDPDKAQGTQVEMVKVPKATGLYYGDASAIIEEAGLVPVDVSVHGPIDEDAGEIGKVYRQTPAAGQSVPKGTSIELRSWWESQ